MIGVLLVKPLLLLGGAGYLAHRLLQKTVNSPPLAKRKENSQGAAGSR